jgi:hypothetical protein
MLRARAADLASLLGRLLSTKAAARRGGKAADGQPPPPQLRETMRRLAFLVHPDRFAGQPAAAEENAASLAALQGLLSTVQKQKDGHPPAAIHRLGFHVHAAEGGTRRVSATLKTTGGNCKAVVERGLGELFSKLGLPPSFRWAAGDWAVLSQAERDGRDNRGDGDGRAAAEEAQPQPPQPSPQPRRQQQAAAAAAPPPPLAETLAALDPLLHALAAVPWLPATEDGALRRHMLLHDIMPDLQRRGWLLERAAHKVWLGERDTAALLAAEGAAGADAASLEAIKTLLYHAKRLDKELGPAPQAAGGGA